MRPRRWPSGWEPEFRDLCRPRPIFWSPVPAQAPSSPKRANSASRRSTKRNGSNAPDAPERPRRLIPSAIQIRARRRQADRAFHALGRQGLIKAAIVALEGDRTGGEIDEPDPRRDFAHFLARGVVTGEETIVPEFARALVMFAQGLHVVDLE